MCTAEEGQVVRGARGASRLLFGRPCQTDRQNVLPGSSKGCLNSGAVTSNGLLGCGVRVMGGQRLFYQASSATAAQASV